MTERSEVVISDDVFGELYAQLNTMLVGYAYGQVGDSHTSEDVVAEAFLSVLAMVRRGAGPTPETFLSYMRVCIRNEAIRRGRADSRELTVDTIEDVVDQNTRDQLQYAPDYGADEAEEAAMRALASLPAQAQQLLWSLEVDGQKLATVAATNNQSVGATTAAAFRARKALRQNYLIERTVVDACEGLPTEYLAQYALDSAPQKRKNRVVAHLQTCAKCSATLQRMRSLALGASAILVLAGSGPFVRDLIWGAGRAAHAADGVSRTGAKWVLTRTTRRLLVGGVGAACAVIVALLLFTQQQPDTTPSSVQEQPSNSEAAEAVSADPAAEQGGESGTPDDTGRDPESTTRERDRDATPESQTTELPDGVRSLAWQDPTWSGSGTAAKGTLLLTVVFDQNTAADNYEVVLTPRANTTILQASAGCVTVQSTIVCTPDESFQGLDRYNWKLVVQGDAASFEGLPEATIRPIRR